MRFVQIEMLPEGKALVDIDKLTHAVPEGSGSRLFLGAQLNIWMCRTRWPSWKTYWRGGSVPTTVSRVPRGSMCAKRTSAASS